MPRPLVFLLIAAIGGPLGYTARGAMEPIPDRAAAMVDLFIAHCLPLSKGLPAPMTDNLIALGDIPHLHQLADPSSQIILELGPDSCSVDDALLNLRQTDRDKLESSVIAMVETEWPNLHDAAKQGLSGWQVFKVWNDKAFFIQAKTILTLTRFQNVGEDATTALSIHFPNAK